MLIRSLTVLAWIGPPRLPEARNDEAFGRSIFVPVALARVYKFQVVRPYGKPVRRDAWFIAACEIAGSILLAETGWMLLKNSDLAWQSESSGGPHRVARDPSTDDRPLRDRREISI
jgi:hypothetical protein